MRRLLSTFLWSAALIVSAAVAANAQEIEEGGEPGDRCNECFNCGWLGTDRAHKSGDPAEPSEWAWNVDHPFCAVIIGSGSAACGGHGTCTGSGLLAAVPNAPARVLAHLEAGEFGELARLADLHEGLTLNTERRALQLFNCSGSEVIAHYQLNRSEYVKYAIAVKRTELRVAMSSWLDTVRVGFALATLTVTGWVV